eukprot:NODE_3381_length_365_cov_41.575949_g3299_i0.p1 GENE.NODE_3381_length_365_cov_41.575949_g3299_i0~~NODE_3381_length_365_cov_41.575949_g3299_i0.p1  ORF type:complete len:78 (+),score=13.02 NODE_3381_length_365_cov_41.575949_g3299_i0:99-332(+)
MSSQKAPRELIKSIQTHTHTHTHTQLYDCLDHFKAKPLKTPRLFLLLLHVCACFVECPLKWFLPLNLCLREVHLHLV